MQDSAHFKEKLLILKKEITNRINSIDKDIRHEGMSADWTEQAIERENDEVLESLGNSAEVELANINKALQRIESGEYFSCSQCGNDIPRARLELLPFSLHCVSCEEKLND
ncbi:MAG: TraR/DksA C4-type zinc finger protein [Gammaproteobacteria bacterium]|nr:TraR/DksA C4-type zinc finger protein [Gammaproteobacteria bacterium]